MPIAPGFAITWLSSPAFPDWAVRSASTTTAGLRLPVALLAGMGGAGLVAIVIDKIGYQPFRDAPLVTPMLSTLGFSIILQNVATNVWGSDPLQLSDEVLAGRFTFGPISI